jgi:hypothetical protein
MQRTGRWTVKMMMKMKILKVIRTCFDAPPNYSPQQDVFCNLRVVDLFVLFPKYAVGHT